MNRSFELFRQTTLAGLVLLVGGIWQSSVAIAEPPIDQAPGPPDTAEEAEVEVIDVSFIEEPGPLPGGGAGFRCGDEPVVGVFRGMVLIRERGALEAAPRGNFRIAWSNGPTTVVLRLAGAQQSSIGLDDHGLPVINFSFAQSSLVISGVPGIINIGPTNLRVSLDPGTLEVVGFAGIEEVGGGFTVIPEFICMILTM